MADHPPFHDQGIADLTARKADLGRRMVEQLAGQREQAPSRALGQSLAAALPTVIAAAFGGLKAAGAGAPGALKAIKSARGRDASSRAIGLEESKLEFSLLSDELKQAIERQDLTLAGKRKADEAVLRQTALAPGKKKVADEKEASQKRIDAAVSAGKPENRVLTFDEARQRVFGPRVKSLIEERIEAAKGRGEAGLRAGEVDGIQRELALKDSDKEQLAKTRFGITQAKLTQQSWRAIKSEAPITRGFLATLPGPMVEAMGGVENILTGETPLRDLAINSQFFQKQVRKLALDIAAALQGKQVNELELKSIIESMATAASVEELGDAQMQLLVQASELSQAYMLNSLGVEKRTDEELEELAAQILRTAPELRVKFGKSKKSSQELRDSVAKKYGIEVN